MSKVGKKPVVLPTGVKVSVGGGGVTVEGPRGKLDYRPARGIQVAVKDGAILVEPEGQTQQSNIDFGTTRAILNNMVTGVTKGWKQSLELNGVGYGAQVADGALVLTVGFSHEVKLPVPKGLTCKVSKNLIEMESNDRQVVGEFAALVRRVRPPEPYLGKGIKYVEEVIRREAGKTAA